MTARTNGSTYEHHFTENNKYFAMLAEDADLQRELLEICFDTKAKARLLNAYYAESEDRPAPWQVYRDKQGFIKRVALPEIIIGDLLRLLIPVLYEPEEDQFYRYDHETGLWRPETRNWLQFQLAKLLLHIAPDQLQLALHQSLTQKLQHAAIEQLKGRIERREVFSRRDRHFVHVANGVLDMQALDQGLQPFSPDWYSRNRVELAFEPDAECQRFMDVLHNQLGEEDVLLLQRWVGSVMLGANHAQRIMLIHGAGGTGKSAIAAVIEGIIGIRNVASLRTSQLNGQFEFYAYLGKQLLSGKDVPADFLQQRGAGQLKALTGGDYLQVEAKFSNRRPYIRGDFNVMVVANSRLRVRLEGDEGAWRRRLLVMEFNKPPEQRISNFAATLLSEEGAGILAWAIEGARAHLGELADGGDFQLTRSQRLRTDALLMESQSVAVFVGRCLEIGEGDVTVNELVEAYFSFCNRQGWSPLSVRQVQSQLPDAILDQYGKSKRTDVKREGRNQRGFVGLRLVKREGDDQ